MITPKANLFLCTAFVASLATVGVLSHTTLKSDINLANLLNGSVQSRYEEGFKKANPLEQPAISALASFKYALLSQASFGALIGHEGWMFSTEEFQSSDTFNQNIIAAVHKIASLSHRLSNDAITLVPVIVPDKAEVYSEKLKTKQPKQIQRRKTRLLAGLRGLGVPALDASDVLTFGKLQAETYMRNDTHWSPAGSRAVAEMIAQSLQDADYTRADVDSVTKEPVRFEGDLLSFVPTKSFRRLFGPAQQSIQTFETTVQSGVGLFDAPDVDVVLVGTSFSAKSEFHFEGFLKQALQADLLNFASEGQGPFSPMEAYLASETFEVTPPKIIIWEIPARYTSMEFSK